MNYKNYFLFLILFLCFYSFIGAQSKTTLILDIDGTSHAVPAVKKRGVVFVSAKELARGMGGGFYYSPKTAKLEMKFSNYRLKFTARNQFVIIERKTGGDKSVYQLPISTLLLDGDVFIPLVYAIDYINNASGRYLSYENGSNRIVEKKGDYISGTGNSSVTPDVEIRQIHTPKADPNAPDYDIYDLKIEEKVNGTLIKMKSKKEMGRIHFSITQDKGLLFLYGASVQPGIAGTKTAGLVKKVESKRVGNNNQLIFELKGEYKDYESFQDEFTNDIYITIHNKRLALSDNDIEVDKQKWNFDAIVIDPGHGGKDPGAIGITGFKEKDANLGIGLELGKLIEEKMDSVKVIYTRKTDKFIELHKRGKIANENGGKLFISIHCNSLGKKHPRTRGFEVYLLRPGRTDEAIEIAEFENSVIKYEDNPGMYEKLTDENFILVSMAHSSYMRYSEKFSDVLNTKWKNNVNIPSRGIKQAGFYVLVGASMPGVLIESGFISNRMDESILKSKKGQKSIAEAIFKAITEYKEYYESTFIESPGFGEK